jgi:hypothetical protein
MVDLMGSPRVVQKVQRMVGMLVVVRAGWKVDQ